MHIAPASKHIVQQLASVSTHCLCSTGMRTLTSVFVVLNLLNATLNGFRTSCNEHYILVLPCHQKTRIIASLACHMSNGLADTARRSYSQDCLHCTALSATDLLFPSTVLCELLALSFWTPPTSCSAHVNSTCQHSHASPLHPWLYVIATPCVADVLGI